MDTESKIIFLNAVFERREELFGKVDGHRKDELWLEVYDECVAKGCTGIKDAEHLRRTTYQNLQRRAKDKFEKGLKMGMHKVSFTVIDTMVLKILNLTPDMPHDFQIHESSPDPLLTPDELTKWTLQRLIGSATKMETEEPNVSSSSSQEMLDEHEDSPPPTMVVNVSPDVATSNSAFSDKAPSPTLTARMFPNNRNPTAKRRRPQAALYADDEFAALKRQKLQAEIRLIEAQTRSLEKELQLKNLQILALRRSLDGTFDFSTELSVGDYMS